MKINPQFRKPTVHLAGLLAVLLLSSASAQHAYLEDAQYEETRGFLAPLEQHAFPRITLTETKTSPTNAESVSKYDSILLDGFMMTTAVEQAQKINPNLLVFRKFNASGYRGFTFPNPCNDTIGNPFGSTGPSTSVCAWHAGHWAYYAGTNSSQAMTATSTSVVVADATRVTPGRYVVIYDAPAGSFENAEHALVSSVSGNTVTFSQRGFKSVARSHPAGSIIAEHPVAGSAKGTEEPQHWMYNMSSACPLDANGNQLADAMATWLRDNLLRGPQSRIVNLRVDGVMFDTDSWSVAWRNRLDLDNDLVADGGWDSTNGINFWGDGMEHFYRMVRESLPDKFVIGGDRVIRGFETLNGTQMEGWPVSGVYHSATPEYLKMDELLSKSVMHLREGPQHMPSFVENFSKTPTKAYPYGVTPVPSSNAPFRFGLGTSLLDDGYYGQELASETRDPWWDEFAVDVAPGSPTFGHAIAANPQDESLARMHRGWLGQPWGPRERLYDEATFALNRSLLQNGGLDNSSSLNGWTASNVRLAFESMEKMAGSGSVSVSAHLIYGASAGNATVRTPAVGLKAGVEYTLVFSAKAAQTRNITVGAGPSYQTFVVPDYWVRRAVSFTATTTGNASMVFQVGQENIPLWLDEVYVFEGSANVYTREFDNGLVVVNAGPQPKTVDLGQNYLRIKGTGQDPINDGASVSSVVVGAYDAAILVRPEVIAELSISNVTVNENEGIVRFVVSLTPSVAKTVTVSYATEDGSAQAGSDYTAVSGSLSFALGETERTVEIPVLDDLLHETTEDFKLILSAPSGATLAVDIATAVIIDNDAMPGLSVADVTVSEGDGAARFSVSLSAPSALPVTVSYATVDGSAQAGSDYTAVSGSLSFAAGETERAVDVPVLDNLLHEATESFSLVLSGATGATLERASAIGTIADNDAMPGLSVADVAVSEGDGMARFAVSLSAPSALPVTVSYATVDGSAQAGSDYTAVSGSLSFAAGETERTVEVPVLDDLLHEATEGFSLVLSDASGATLVRASAIGTISDDDAEVVSGPTCGAPAYSSATETGVFLYYDCDNPNLWHARFTAGGRSVSYRGDVSSNGAFQSLVGVSQEASDVLNPAPFTTPTLGPIAYIQNVGSTGWDGFDINSAAGFDVCFALSAPTNVPVWMGANRLPVTLPLNLATFGSCASSPTPTVAVGDVTVLEGDGVASFAVKLSGTSGMPISFDYTTADGSAIDGVDYTAVSGSLSFAPGEIERSIVVPILDNSEYEATKTFGLVLSNAVRVHLATVEATATIIDDDAALVSCGMPTFARGSDPGVFVWQDCSTGQWYLRAVGGGLVWTSYSGSLESNKAFSNVVGVELEGADQVDVSTGNRIAFTLGVGGMGVDGIDFAIQSESQVCLGLTAPVGAQVYLGAEKMPMSGSFDLVTLERCEK